MDSDIADKLRLFLTAHTFLLLGNFAQNPTQESLTFARLNVIKLLRFSHLGNICRSDEKGVKQQCRIKT